MESLIFRYTRRVGRVAYCIRLLTGRCAGIRRFESCALRHLTKEGGAMAKGFQPRLLPTVPSGRRRVTPRSPETRTSANTAWKRGDITPAVMVHHIKGTGVLPNVDDPDIATNPDNLVSLCDRCHKQVHGWIEGRARPGRASALTTTAISCRSINDTQTQQTTRGAAQKRDAKPQVNAADNPPIPKHRDGWPGTNAGR